MKPQEKSSTAAEPVEIELKFQVPPAVRERVRRAVTTASAQTTRLQAVYADTADHRLAGAAMALRLRKEGRVWVQTLKGRGDGLMQRLEDEHRLPPQRGEPTLDPARHAGSAAGQQLQTLLADGAELLPIYRTDVQRTHRRLRSGGAVIEIAFDVGHISAGRQRIPVCELEFELVSGPSAALVTLASRWVERHGLWLDVRTKSERGHRLARGLTTVPAVHATKAALDKSGTCRAAFGVIVQSALAQVLPNAAELASGHGAAEHLHQLRVGLRRLRSALRLFGEWSGDADAAVALEQRLREPFARLGAARDQDALAASLLPALAAAGGPPLPPLPGRGESPVAVLHEPAFTLVLLEALRLVHAEPVAADRGAAPEDVQPPSLRKAARRALQRSWRKAMQDADSFATAEIDAQHRTRKRLKRFRYGAEFVVGLFPGKATTVTLSALRETLDALGAYNDVLVAEERFTALVDTDPRAWFALGWLSGQREKLLRKAARSLQRLQRTPRFWH